jgi:DNA invertase Pin-like site-specific DNA recombinase
MSLLIARDSASPARQRQGVEALCASRGWELAEVVTDIDQSAFNGRRRPGFDSLMQRLDEIDVLVFWRLDRLARSLSQLLQIAEACERADVQLASTDGEVDTTTAAGRAFYQMRGVFAEFESATLSERSRQMMQFKRDRGEPTGRTPFGWRRNGKGHEPDPEQQAALREAAERFIAGETFSAIAPDIGLPVGSLSRILRSQRVLDALPRKLSGPLAQALRDRAWNRVPTSKQSLLGGIATCAECGATMAKVSTRGGRKGGPWYSYACRSSHAAISGRWLDQYVTEQVIGAIDTGKP